MAPALGRLHLPETGSSLYGGPQFGGVDSRSNRRRWKDGCPPMWRGGEEVNNSALSVQAKEFER